MTDILTAALVLSCCTIPAFAVSKAIYPDGCKTVDYSTAELTDPAQSRLRLTGDLTQTDTFVNREDGNYTCPVSIPPRVL